MQQEPTQTFPLQVQCMRVGKRPGQKRCFASKWLVGGVRTVPAGAGAQPCPRATLVGSGGRVASGRAAKAEQRRCWPHSCLGPWSCLAAPAGPEVAGRMPSTLPQQQDFPRAPLPWHQRASGFHSCPPRSLRLGVCSAGAQGSLATWVGEGKEGEAAASARVGAGPGAGARDGGGRRAEPAVSLYTPGVTLLFATVSLQNGIPRAFQVLKLGIQSNWGKPGYTCIRRVQVYGKIAGTNAISQTHVQTSPN